jgi:predicted amidohydrolase
MTSFTAVAIQSDITMVDPTASRADIKKIRDKNLDRALTLIDWACAYRYNVIARIGDESGNALVGLPESFLHGFPRAEGARVENLVKVAITIPGEETERLSEKARRYNCYIFGAAFEVDPEWPGRYFNCGFIIDPKGDVILKYRKIDAGLVETATSPHEILDAYVERYGYDALFPVVETSIGRLGMMICADALYGPEIARAIAMRGAEIICYPISTISSDHRYYHITAQVRAMDNACYVVSPNAGVTYSPQRPGHTGGESVIVDFEGRTLVQAAPTGETTIQSMLHLDALRSYRMRSRHGVASLRAECYAPLYQRTYMPANFFLKEPEVSLADENRLRDVALQRMLDDRIYSLPGSKSRTLVGAAE